MNCIDLRDYGPMPYVVNIQEAANQNYNYRLALWTGNYLQLTLMNINAKEDIGLEMHPDVDQFIRIEEGQGLVLMGDSQDRLYYQARVYPGYVIFIPAGKWHNLINTGCTPLSSIQSMHLPSIHGALFIGLKTMLKSIIIIINNVKQGQLLKTVPINLNYGFYYIVHLMD